MARSPRPAERQIGEIAALFREQSRQAHFIVLLTWAILVLVLFVVFLTAVQLL